MKKIKTFLSGINNMLIFLFKVDLSKWRVLFHNKFFRIYFSYCFDYYLLIPTIDFVYFKQSCCTCESSTKFLISIRFIKYFLFIKVYNQ